MCAKTTSTIFFMNLCKALCKKVERVSQTWIITFVRQRPSPSFEINKSERGAKYNLEMFRKNGKNHKANRD